MGGSAAVGRNCARRAPRPRGLHRRGRFPGRTEAPEAARPADGDHLLERSDGDRHPPGRRRGRPVGPRESLGGRLRRHRGCRLDESSADDDRTADRRHRQDRGRLPARADRGAEVAAELVLPPQSPRQELHRPRSEVTPWWQSGAVYQIYPRSFLDTDGDGVGDLGGITRGLAYLEWLGVDAIWISPIYPSPMADFGYDITDHIAIDPRFGTLADFDAMIHEAHRLGLRVILDYVPNHTSDRHPWFLASRTARDDPHRDWYIWRDPARDGGPP